MGFGRIFLPLLLFSLLEIWVLSLVAGVIGWPLTIVLVVLSALLGSVLFRHQGMETWARLNRRVQAGEMPGKEVAEGVMLLIGSVCLITPGFITDTFGLLLLIPQSRRAMAGWLVRKGKIQILAGNTTRWRRGDHNVYEGEATVHSEPSRPGSGPLTLDRDATDPSGRR